jgi:hypothetical protein
MALRRGSRRFKGNHPRLPRNAEIEKNEGRSREINWFKKKESRVERDQGRVAMDRRRRDWDSRRVQGDHG